MKQALSQLLFTALLLLTITIAAYGVELFVGIPGSQVASAEKLHGADAAPIRPIAVPVR